MLFKTSTSFQTVEHKVWEYLIEPPPSSSVAHFFVAFHITLFLHPVTSTPSQGPLSWTAVIAPHWPLHPVIGS